MRTALGETKNFRSDMDIMKKIDFSKLSEFSLEDLNVEDDEQHN